MEREAKKKVSEETLFNATKSHAVAKTELDLLKSQDAINAAQKELDTLLKEKEESEKQLASITSDLNEAKARAAAAKQNADEAEKEALRAKESQENWA